MTLAGPVNTPFNRARGQFPHIQFGNDSPEQSRNSLRLDQINQWGDIEWRSMKQAFKGCENLTLKAEDTPDLSSVEKMHQMFALARKFEDRGGAIGRCDISQVANMRGMFRAARNFNGNVGNWNTSQVTDMFGMFASTKVFNQNVQVFWQGNDLESIR